MILEGVLYPKANSRRFVYNKRTGKPMFIKSAKALACEESFKLQAKAQWKSKPLDRNVAIQAIVFYPNKRHDLEIELLKDILQGICYNNDRQVVEMRAQKYIDKDNPRVIVTIMPDERDDTPWPRIEQRLTR